MKKNLPDKLSPEALRLIELTFSRDSMLMVSCASAEFIIEIRKWVEGQVIKPKLGPPAKMP